MNQVGESMRLSPCVRTPKTLMVADRIVLVETIYICIRIAKILMVIDLYIFLAFLKLCVRTIKNLYNSPCFAGL